MQEPTVTEVPGPDPVVGSRRGPHGVAGQPWEVRWAVVATLLFLIGLALDLGGGPVWSWYPLYAACYVAGGWEPARAGLRALRRRALDVDLLMVVAAVVAASIGQVRDGGLLIVIFASSGAVEAVATRRTQDSVRSLLALAPDRATRVGADGGEEVVDTERLEVGDVIVVRPGERIGADGEVVSGSSDVDQASITGEAMPVPVGAGSAVLAGTVNGDGSLRVGVTRPAAESVAARIVEVVAEAGARKAPTQLFIEKVERRYSVGVVVATLALLGLPELVGHEAFRIALLRAMTFMIVASPCAVVLATMPPLLSAIANAGRHGVLVKSAVVMEQLAAITAVVFDKTGTLTGGDPRVAAVRPLAGSGIGADDLLWWAAAAEAPSEHPLGRAIVAAARGRGLEPATVDGFRSRPGRGVEALLAGRRVEVLSPAAIETRSPMAGRAVAAAGDLAGSGHTVAVVVLDGQPVGLLGLTDTIRPGVDSAITCISALTGRPPGLLTGDNSGAAHLLAARTGLGDLHADLLPDGKAAVIRDMQAGGERVLAVGDGINDAPMLATADVGMALGRHGADLALETAGAVIVHDELGTIPAVIAISRAARRLMRQNLVLAVTVIAGLVAVDLFGRLPLPLGVAGHEGSTVVIGLNGLRLLRSRAWTPAPEGAARRGRVGSGPRRDDRRAAQRDAGAGRGPNLPVSATVWGDVRGRSAARAAGQGSGRTPRG